jgi:hypothetical protein
MADGRLTAEEVLEHYCRLVYASTASYKETARRLGLDWRTVKEKVAGRARSADPYAGPTE